MKNRPALLLSLLAAILPACSEGPKKDTPVLCTGQTMGTGYSIKVRHPKAGRQAMRLKIHEDVEQMLEQINRQMSTYLRDSEISRFNEGRSTTWFPVSGELAEVIEQALRVSQKSHGAFDITIGPLVNLWGFGPEKTDAAFPGEEAIERTLGRVGFHRLILRQNPPALRKEEPDMVCDLSGIAKGYAVDKIAYYLNANGFADFLVEIGGEIRALGQNSRGLPWQVGIETPDGSGRIQRVVALRDSAIATSGDYRSFFEKDGVRYSHTIDPRTGKPVAHGLASVTVIHDSCCYADAMATAIQVLGPEEGYALALRENLAACLINRTRDGYAEQITPGFRRYLNDVDVEKGDDRK